MPRRTRGEIVGRRAGGRRRQRLAAAQVATEEALRLVERAHATHQHLAVAAEPRDRQLLEAAVEVQGHTAIGKAVLHDAFDVAPSEAFDQRRQRGIVGAVGLGESDLGQQQRAEEKREQEQVSALHGGSGVVGWTRDRGGAWRAGAGPT